MLFTTSRHRMLRHENILVCFLRTGACADSTLCHSMMFARRIRLCRFAYTQHRVLQQGMEEHTSHMAQRVRVPAQLPALACVV